MRFMDMQMDFGSRNESLSIAEADYRDIRVDGNTKFYGVKDVDARTSVCCVCSDDYLSYDD